MMPFHSRLNAGGNDVCHCLSCALKQAWQISHLLLGKRRQDIAFDHRFAVRSPDAEPDSVEVRSTEMIDYGYQPFMPAMTSACLQTDRQERQVQVIMYDDNIFKIYPVIVGQLPYRDAAQIHECLRLDKKNGAAVDFSLSDLGIKEGLAGRYTMLQGQLIHDQETCVMTVKPIPYPRISQSNDQFHTKLPSQAVRVDREHASASDSQR